MWGCGFQDSQQVGPPDCSVKENCYNEVMVLELKVRKIGNSLGVVLPKEVLAHLEVEEEETLTLTDTRDGVRLTAAKPGFVKTKLVFERLSRRYRNALRELSR